MNKKAHILLGGNLPETKNSFELALDMFAQNSLKIEVKSRIYSSEPWGYESQNVYLNQVIILVTNLSSRELLTVLLSIESSCGRKRGSIKQYEDRVIDIDLLFMDEEVCNDNVLTLPHPKLHVRRFTLVPLVEVSATKIHPLFHKSIEELLDICPDHSQVCLHE